MGLNDSLRVGRAYILWGIPLGARHIRHHSAMPKPSKG